MPSDEYTSVVRGGLKLKGTKPSGVTKKKKKPKPPKDVEGLVESGEGGESDLRRALAEEDAASKETMRGEGAGEGMDDSEQMRKLDPRGDDGKTASERQYEEMRRKRLQDRLVREGVKTHKQRVEELNKYLSTLSEHHDMPRIGPG